MSSSEDEDVEIFKDVVDHSFIESLRKGNHCQAKGGKGKEVNSKPQNGFEDHIYRILEKRLAREYEEVEMMCPVKKKVQEESSGIKLFSDSKVLLTEDNMFEEKPVIHPRKVKKIKESVLIARAHEAAVSPEWVFSKSGTECWTDNRKPRVASFKVCSALENGGFECTVIQDF